ncbi:methylated-DNA--[protein]-cysteine S-methyltransferase [Chitinophaga sp. 212800010-3]|uniref:methylated-DNA--[protein]-cysteine S-methyltransferase n=1 Tax=unclassified Chitinophaga TaxID=2619133 RepID=UPI002DEB6D96|nr:hypothetical protein [Chitinophaga sp. 212800010-3]
MFLSHSHTPILPAQILERMTATSTFLEAGKETHNGFIIESLTPDEFRKAGLRIYYANYPTRFGRMMIATTPKGICCIAPVSNEPDAGEDELKQRFPGAFPEPAEHPHHQLALRALEEPDGHKLPVPFHLKATAFQLAVWKTLLQIPMGGLLSYAALTGESRNARAAGTAVGDNPIFFLIPCHRAVRTNGTFGPYFWGPEWKRALITWESQQEPG